MNFNEIPSVLRSLNDVSVAMDILLMSVWKSYIYDVYFSNHLSTKAYEISFHFIL